MPKQFGGLGILVICPDSVSYRVVDFLLVDLALETVDLSHLISMNFLIYTKRPTKIYRFEYFSCSSLKSGKMSNLTSIFFKRVEITNQYYLHFVDFYVKCR